MAGYKKRAPAKRKPATTKRRVMNPRRAPVLKDGQNLIVNGYFEARKTLVSANESFISYSINIDPKNATLTNGADVTFYDGGANGGDPVANSTLSYLKYNTFDDIYNQYRVNSATVIIRVDTVCGIENAVITSNDKGVADPHATMNSALSSAHKSNSLTVSKRECKYMIKNMGQDKDFLSTKANQNQDVSERKYIKVFQKLPKGAGSIADHVCEHQVQVILSLTMKDSKSLN